MNSNRTVIIVGGNHHNTLGVIRALGFKIKRELIYLILDGNDKSYVSKSKYIIKSNTFYIKNEKEIVSTIQLIVKKTNKLKPVVIACGDHYIAELDKNYDYLKQICILPNAKDVQGRINKFLNKQVQKKLAYSYNLLVPKSETMAVKDLDNYDHIPCIIKPNSSIAGEKSDIVICTSYEDLLFYKQNHSHLKYVIVEHYIDKLFEFQLIGCSLKNKILIPGYTKIIRQPQNTNTGYLSYSPIGDGVIPEILIDKVKSLLRKIGYVGLFSVEFIRDKRGTDYFLEINLRNDGNAFCVTTTGINLPYIWYKYGTNMSFDYSGEKVSFTKSVFWMPETDFQNVREIGFLKWFKEWFFADSHAIVYHKDYRPFLYFISNKLFAK